jgi:hypothetical protein
MKSWINILISGMLIFIGINFVSCVDEDNGSTKEPEEAGQGYLSFQFSTNTVNHASRVSTDYGTAEERKVTKLYLLLYERPGSLERLVRREEIKADNTSGVFTGDDVVNKPGITPTEHSFVSKPILLGEKVEDKREYQAVILANPTPEILSKVVVGVNKLSDLQAVIANAKAEDFITNDGIFMTNAGGVKLIYKTDLKTDTGFAEKEPVQIAIERILAKVFVYENRSNKLTEATEGGTIESVSWALSSINKQTYLIREQDKLKGGNDYESGFTNDRSLVYARDPNFIGNKNIIGNEQELNKNFTFVDPFGTNGFKPWNENDKKAEYYQYILENTISADEQNDVEIDPASCLTHVILKAVIKNPDKITTGDDYYSFSYYNTQNNLQWKAFTHAQAVEWFNGTYPADMPNLKEAMTEAQTQNGSPFNFKIINEIIPPAPAGYASVKTTYGQITFHKGGLNIYRIPIQHFGTDGAKADDYGYLGVVRNNTYNIVINSINGPGVGTSDEGYISTRIVVNPWFVRGWEVGLTPVEP